MNFIYFLIILFVLTLLLQWYMDTCDEDFRPVHRYYSENTDGVQDINLTVNNDYDYDGYTYPWYSPTWYSPTWYSPWNMPTRRWNRHVFYPHVYNYYRGYY